MFLLPENGGSRYLCRGVISKEPAQLHYACC